MNENCKKVTFILIFISAGIVCEYLAWSNVYNPKNKEIKSWIASTCQISHLNTTTLTCERNNCYCADHCHCRKESYQCYNYVEVWRILPSSINFTVTEHGVSDIISPDDTKKCWYLNDNPSGTVTFTDPAVSIIGPLIPIIVICISCWIKDQRCSDGRHAYNIV